MRPLARSYLQHGSRHGPQGSDPIPVFAGLPAVAYAARTSTQTVPHGTTINSSFTSTTHSSDTSKLDWITTTLTSDTLSIIGSGFAQVIASCRWTPGTNIDMKINTGSGFEVFPHDGFGGFKGFGTASSGSVMPTLMDICWIDTTASPNLPVFVKLTNSDGSDNGPSEVRIGCIFYPNLL